MALLEQIQDAFKQFVSFATTLLILRVLSNRLNTASYSIAIKLEYPRRVLINLKQSHLGRSWTNQTSFADINR